MPASFADDAGFAVLGYPFFLLGSSGSAGLAFLAQFLMVAFLSLYAGSCPAAYAELFPTRVRYTALSIGYNVAVAIFGGFAASVGLLAILPVALDVAILALEVLVAALQAYVFAILTCLYLRDALHLH